MKNSVKNALKGTVIEIETTDATMTAQVKDKVVTLTIGETAVSLTPFMVREMAKKLKSLADTIGESPYRITSAQGKVTGNDFEMCLLAENDDKTIAATMTSGQAKTFAKMIGEMETR